MSLWKLLYIHDCSYGYGCTKVPMVSCSNDHVEGILDGRGEAPAKSFETAWWGVSRSKHWHPWPRYPMTFSPPSRPVTPVAPVSPTPLTVPSTSQTQMTQAEVQPASDIEEMVTWFVLWNLQALELSKMMTKKHLLILFDTNLILIWYYCILILLQAFLSCGINIACCGHSGWWLLIALSKSKICRQLRWNWILSLHRSCKIKGDNNGDWNIPKWKTSYPRQAWSVPLSPVEDS